MPPRTPRKWDAESDNTAAGNALATNTPTKWNRVTLSRGREPQWQIAIKANANIPSGVTMTAIDKHPLNNNNNNIPSKQDTMTAPADQTTTVTNAVILSKRTSTTVKKTATYNNDDNIPTCLDTTTTEANIPTGQEMTAEAEQSTIITNTVIPSRAPTTAVSNKHITN
jgi:hypothetical protein